MTLTIYISLTPKIENYMNVLGSSLLKNFHMEIKQPGDIELLRVPIKKGTESTVMDVVKRHTDNRVFKIRLVTKYNTDQISLTNPKIEISIDERSWNQVVDFQKPLLNEIQPYIDTTNPIIVQADTHHSERPKEYVRKYGTDKVLNWWGASILLGKEADLKRRREIYRYISEKHQIDVKIKDVALVRIA